MENSAIETYYPLTFRQEDANTLGKYLKNRQSVILIGMKRVGISNFLRFFLHHKEVVKKYVHTGQHLFIPVDLNDLVEREIFPFWILTLKRIYDIVETSDQDSGTKRFVETLFLDSIQSKDLFLTIESIRKSLTKLVEKGISPTIFFIRFDRMKDAATTEFLSNLEGLRDATSHKLAYVFTSYRELEDIKPEMFTRSSLAVFSHNIYIKPAKREDIQVAFTTYKKQYKLALPPSLEESLFEIVDGYMQYFQLALVLLHEEKIRIKTKEELFTHLAKDERIWFQSEELWESLKSHEQWVLQKIHARKAITERERKTARYLWDMGLVNGEEKKEYKIFSPLFSFYLSEKEVQKPTATVEFSKKEHALFTFLMRNKDVICEREQIIEAVWPEVEALGVSDWAIDRLVARVRTKLGEQKSEFKIQTIKTRGYKLVTVS